jgi:predicted O-methyltransferase YrrM/glycosyltransferase involved in cell wall biosynthesis
MKFKYKRNYFYHDEKEFEEYKIDTYDTLKFHKDIGKLETEVGLLCDISTDIFNNECTLTYLDGKCSNFVPIMCGNSFKTVNISSNVNNKDNISNYCGKNNMIIDAEGTTGTQDIIIRGSTGEVIITNNSIIDFKTKYTKIKLVLLKKELYLFITPTLLSLFMEKFRYYFSNGLFYYENLVHFTMIVKNGGNTLENMLKTNMQHFDRWTILDTGSTDGTQEVIKRVLANKKGNLYEEDFINFRDSRNRCLELAGNNCKYTIMMDDTYTLTIPTNSMALNLKTFLYSVNDDIFAESYSFTIQSNDIAYASNRIFKTQLNLRYIYTIHEVLEKSIAVLIPQSIIYINDEQSEFMIDRTHSRKEYDLKLLFEMVEEEPYNPRHLYYIAQTYNILDMPEKAAEYFLKRINHEEHGTQQERLDAYLELARIYKYKLNKPWDECYKYYNAYCEIDKERNDALYFIALHYYDTHQHDLAYTYFLKAYTIGCSENKQHSVKPIIDNFFIPKFLVELCYNNGNFILGEECCKKIIDNYHISEPILLSYEKVNSSNGTNNIDIYKSWYNIFSLLNKKGKGKPPGPLGSEGKVGPLGPMGSGGGNDKIVFIADGGFSEWTGKDILNKGLGGSETHVVEIARYIKSEYNNKDVYVFCKCKETEIFEGVTYMPLSGLIDFLDNNYIKHCIISRFSEYIPLAIHSYVENIYLFLHDLGPSGLVIPRHNKLKQIFCLTDWHKRYFTTNFPQLADITVSFYHGIDMNKIANIADHQQIKTQRNRFIYSSFPNRGLVYVLLLWNDITIMVPDAELHLYCDLDGEWVNKNFPDEMNIIKLLLSKYKNVINHGWVNKDELIKGWLNADVWFYPCKFMETFCLTALEAAHTKTLAVTTDLAALGEIVGDRGIKIDYVPVININVKDGNVYVSDVTNTEGTTTTKGVGDYKAWHTKTLNQIVNILDPKNKDLKDELVQKNYEWTLNMSWCDRTKELMDRYILINKYEYKDMYNWTNDIPQNSKAIYEDIITYFNNKNEGRDVEILEIGSYTGTSLIRLVELIPNSRGTGIDMWTNYNENELLSNMDTLNIEQSFYNNIKTAKLEDRIKGIKNDSTIELFKMIKEEKRFDFIYVDGSHKCNDCYSDMLLSWQLLNKGGIMAIDDYLWVGNGDGDTPLKAVDHFLERYKGQYKLLHKGYRVFIERL